MSFEDRVNRQIGEHQRHDDALLEASTRAAQIEAEDLAASNTALSDLLAQVVSYMLKQDIEPDCKQIWLKRHTNDVGYLHSGNSTVEVGVAGWLLPGVHNGPDKRLLGVDGQLYPAFPGNYHYGKGVFNHEATQRLADEKERQGVSEAVYAAEPIRAVGRHFEGRKYEMYRNGHLGGFVLDQDGVLVHVDVDQYEAFAEPHIIDAETMMIEAVAAYVRARKTIT